jgi:hypothetical protein
VKAVGGGVTAGSAARRHAGSHAARSKAAQAAW